MLLHQWFERHARERADHVALVCESQRYTYAGIDHLARALAITLQGAGLRRGDRVAIYLENCVEAVIAIFAVLKAGGVFMPVNPQVKADKLAYLLRDSEAHTLIAHGTFTDTVTRALDGVSTLRTLIMTQPTTQSIAGKTVMPFDSAVAAADRELVPPATIDQDLAAIIYTSGSTGDAKGVMVTHLNMVTAATSISTYLGLRPDDIILNVLPIAFDYGLYQILMSSRVGATLVLQRSLAFPVKVLETMVREKVTVLPGVPTVFTMLLNLGSFGKYDLGTLRLVTNTAAALSEKQIRDIRASFPTATLFSMYGLTECKRVTYLPPDQLDVRPMSVGKGMPNEELWLVDEQGRRLPNGSTGELVVRGSHVMRGYWRKPQQTAERLKPGELPGEMYLYTGDIFRTDAEGYLYFVGRKDDIIKSRGEKVSPREVENVLHKLDGVLEAAVIGVADEVMGEAVKAFVVLKQGHSWSERDVIKHCLAHLESFMAPKQVVFLDALPRTDTGKITKRGLG
ncbi:MAG TPA: class I adenylate-forming enzyme family protein [Steroidobacteraceae bacterium]|nr:class I adenylate-forming enzyme family protein [Steroidobacteraceae bacterium]